MSINNKKQKLDTLKEYSRDLKKAENYEEEN